MPRPKKPGAPEPKRRSRNGCWPCKSRKIKCDEGHPQCDNCQKSGIECDYSVRLNWLGDGNYRPHKKRRPDEAETTPLMGELWLSSTGLPSQGKAELMAQSQFDDSGHLSAPSTIIGPNTPLPDSSATPITVSVPLTFTPINQSRPIPSTSSVPPRSVVPLLQEPIIGDTYSSTSSDLPLQGSSGLRQEDALEGYGELGSLGSERTSAESAGLGESSAYDESDAADTPASHHPSPKKPVRPVKLNGLTEASSWPPSPASTVDSPGVRSCLLSSFSLPSERSPLTSMSTPGGEDEHHYVSKTTHHASSPPNIRRLSVQSLLASPQDPSRLSEWTLTGHGRGSHQLLARAITPETATFYGYDNGDPDTDIGQNDDEKAILGYSSTDSKGRRASSDEKSRETHPSDFGFAFGMHETRDYYETRVEVWIPKELEPLPPKLRQNPMNLLYFHHFLNHTARVLVPHDDPRSNPFRTVLPQMAVKHDNLLSLLLAYSASHRARFLKHPAPSLRIAHLVQGVITDLSTLVQQAMNDPQTIISTADLAAAIMLASLEIISPAAIGGSIPWHHHLNLARELISRMPDGLRRIQPTTQEDRVRSLLWSWFAYLDVLGSLSGGPATLLTPSCYTTGGPPSPPPPPPPPAVSVLRPANDNDHHHHHTDEALPPPLPPWDDDMERVDCILGFTPRCVFILARIAELARRSEDARLHQQQPAGWHPDAATAAAAAALETAALRSLAAPSRPCGHVHAPSPLRRWDRTQMAAANRAFHHAALIHLHRRVLGKGAAHPDVRAAAQSVLECLEHIERGSSAETCLLFPMFTAGCELVDRAEREIILERILSVERTGMTQVQRARKLMEKVWESGQPWETLVETEFIG